LNQLDQAEVLPVLKEVREVRKRTGCSLFFLMHTPKAEFRGETPPTLANIFGTVATANNIDVVHILRPLKVEKRRDEEDDAEPEQPTGLVEIHSEKMRSAGSGKPPPRVGRLVSVQLPGGRGTTVRFDWVADTTPGQARADLRMGALEEK